MCTNKTPTGITHPSSLGVEQKEMHLPNIYFQVCLWEIEILYCLFDPEGLVWYLFSKQKLMEK